jgi:hypothetical protein
MKMFGDFHRYALDTKRLNYGVITLIPKTKEAERIQQYRPICLLNCLYKWFIKVLTMRMEPVAARIIHRTQSAFIGGRNIMNNILALHENLHETRKRGETGVILKLDFEKAYDKVCWDFLLRCLQVRVFNETWCNWIKSVLLNGTVAVKMNGKVGQYFQSCKGVRQGDPLSPLLFNIVADCLTRMILKAQNNNMLTGLVKYLIPKGVAVLQYADDTILCLEHNLTYTRHVRLLLYVFEQLSGLKINFDKSEVLMIGGILR